MPDDSSWNPISDPISTRSSNPISDPIAPTGPLGESASGPIGSSPPIDPVRQTTLEPIRPSAAWYWLGASIVVVTGIVAAFLIVRALFGVIGAIGDFEFTEVPGEQRMSLDEGEWRLYYEQVGFERVSLSELSVTIEGADGTLVPVAPVTFEEQWSDGEREGYALGTFDIDEQGIYTVSVESVGERSVPGRAGVGRPLFSGLAGPVLWGLGIGALGFVVGTIQLIVVGVRRGRAKRRRRLAGPAPGPSVPPGSTGFGYGTGFGGYAQPPSTPPPSTQPPSTQPPRTQPPSAWPGGPPTPPPTSPPGSLPAPPAGGPGWGR